MVEVRLRLVGEEVDMLQPLAAEVEEQARRRICSYEDGDGLLCDYHGTRDSRAGCLFQAPISAYRSRSCRIRTWNLLRNIRYGLMRI